MIQIKAPDGSIIQFPDGTPDTTIEGVMKENFGGPQPQQDKVAPYGLSGLVTGQQPQVGVGEDMARSILPSLGRGAIGMASFPAQAGQWLGQKATSGLDYLMGVPEEQTAQRQAQAQQILSDATMLPNPANLQQSVEGAIGPWYQPQTVPGEYVDTAGQFAASLPVGGPKNMLAKGAGLLTSALTSETAGQVARQTIPEAEPYARLLGAVAGGKAQPSGRGAILKTAPSQAKVAAKTNAAYGLLRNAGIKYDAIGYQQFADDLAQGLMKDGIDPILHPKASRALELVTKEVGNSPDFQKIDTLRKVTGDVLRSPDAAERRMAGVIMDKLDNFTSNSALVSNGNIPAGQVQKLASHARELARRNILVKQLNEMDRKSQYYVSGTESGLKNQASSYLKSQKGKSLTPEETKAFEKLTRREGFYGLLSTTGGKLNTAILPAITFGSAAGPMGLLGALGAAGATYGTHLGARKLAEVIANRSLDKARKTVLLGKKGQKALPKSGLLNRSTVLPLLGAGTTINNSYGR